MLVGRLAAQQPPPDRQHPGLKGEAVETQLHNECLTDLIRDTDQLPLDQIPTAVRDAVTRRILGEESDVPLTEISAFNSAI